jgi:hypothetical protein
MNDRPIAATIHRVPFHPSPGAPMTTIHKRGRLALAGVLAAAALGSAAPAQADKADRCEAKLERIEQRFRQIEERRGYDAATKWWNEHAWPQYYERCVAP